MAGRPRAMLRRLAEWERRAEQLYEAILAHIPRAYLKCETYLERYEDENGLVWPDKVPKFDPTAYAWKHSLEAAEDLKETIVDIQIGIRRRMELKGIEFDEIEVEPADQEDKSEGEGETPEHADAGGEE